jgi:tetratricopeptide (TPR) repeat protein
MSLFNHLKRWFSRKEDAKPVQVVSQRMGQLLNEAFAAFQAGDKDKAESLLLEALREPDADVQKDLTIYALQLLEYLWFSGEEYQKSIAFFTKRIEQYPREGVSYESRAASLWYSAQQKQALLDYNRALELNPDNFRLLGDRGQIYVELNQPEKAIDDLNQELTKVKSMANAQGVTWSKSEAYIRNGLGAAYAALGNLDGALREFHLSIDLEPQNAWVYFNRAKALDAANNPQKALEDYRKSLSCSDPKLPPYKKEFAEKRIREVTNAGAN